MKYARGDKVEEFETTDAKGISLRVPDAAHPFTHLMFRRWAGCPICNTHLAGYARGRERLARAGIWTVVVFASTAEEILAGDHGALPFHFVPDPQERYYRSFGVGASPWANLHWATFAPALSGWLSGRASLRQVRRFDGLPADLMVRSDGFVVDAYYGDHANDQWTVEETVATAEGLGGRSAA